MASRKTTDNGLDGGLLVFGLLVGLVGGAIVGLLNAPRSGLATRNQITSSVSETGETLRNTVERVAPHDPIGESIAEGKAAARRRRAELGLPAAD
jgi:gas vesicle protein